MINIRFLKIGIDFIEIKIFVKIIVVLLIVNQNKWIIITRKIWNDKMTFNIVEKIVVIIVNEIDQLIVIEHQNVRFHQHQV